MPDSFHQKVFIRVIFLVIVVVLVASGAYYLRNQTPQPSPSPTPPLSPTTQECKVTGCNGEVCIEAQKAEEIATDCQWQPEYACYKNARCERQLDGKCGWTQDETLTKCLQETASDATSIDN